MLVKAEDLRGSGNFVGRKMGSGFCLLEGGWHGKLASIILLSMPKKWGGRAGWLRGDCDDWLIVPRTDEVVVILMKVIVIPRANILLENSPAIPRGEHDCEGG